MSDAQFPALPPELACLLCGNSWGEIKDGRIVRRWCDCGATGAAPPAFAWPEQAAGLACRYCAREDQPDAMNRCRGCGAAHVPSTRLDVTTLADFAPRYRWAPV